MSLINKMLQDLDARGGDGSRADASSLVRPVSYSARGGLSPLAIGAGVLVLAVLGGAGFVAWRYFGGVHKPVAPPAAARPIPPAAAAVPAPQAVRQNGPVAAATSDEGPAVVAGDISPAAHREAGEKLARKMEERNAAARAVAAASAADAGNAVPAPHRPSKETAAAGAGNANRLQEMDRPARARPAETRRLHASAGTKAAPQMAAAAGSAETHGSEAGLNPQQKAENEYRRALAKLQDARVAEAIASLEQALALYPRHEAARQTLVGLLVEAGRTPEAIRHLALATSLDPSQANMAMLLARLQLENGGNALETLQRSLPYAESNAEYRAMMAGVLQRSARHKDAVEHYQAAVRLQPANGAWWMGMGISLQADKRNAEAKIAFERARDSGRLSPALQTFVERRLQQLD